MIDILDPILDMIDAHLEKMCGGDPKEVDMSAIASSYEQDAPKRAITDGAGGASAHASNERERLRRLCVRFAKSDERLVYPDKAVDRLYADGSHLLADGAYLLAELNDRFNTYLAKTLGCVARVDSQRHLPEIEDTFSGKHQASFAKLEAADSMLEAAESKLEADASKLEPGDVAAALIDHVREHAHDIAEIREALGMRELPRFTRMHVVEYLSTNASALVVTCAMLLVLELDVYGMCVLCEDLEYAGAFAGSVPVLRGLDALGAPAFIMELLQRVNAEGRTKFKYPMFGLANKDTALDVDTLIDSSLERYAEYESSVAAISRFEELDAEDDLEYEPGIEQATDMLLEVAFLCKMHFDVKVGVRCRRAVESVRALMAVVDTPLSKTHFGTDDGIPVECFDHAYAALLELWLKAGPEEQAAFVEAFDNLDSDADGTIREV
jgi:hypothetical protein